MSNFCKLLLSFILIFPLTLLAEKFDSKTLKADSVYYDSAKNIITAKGNIFIESDGMLIRAQKLIYDVDNDIIFAEKNVEITDINGRLIKGDKVVFKDKLKKGIIDNFIAKFDESSILVARLAVKHNEHQMSLEKAVFTPCDVTCNKNPIWQISSSKTEVNYKKQQIVYKHLFFELYGIPIIYLPYFTHPTPNAKSKSGILGPKIVNDDFVIPFYYRLKPNLDFTISPRLSQKYTIFDIEYRHKVDDGQYQFSGSYGNPPFKKNIINDENIPGRFYISAVGQFFRNNVNYGFDINKTSDKAYLTNYHNKYDSSLMSKFYVNRINKRNYFLLEGYNFQDLRDTQDKTKAPFVLPEIRTLNVIELSDDDSLLLNIRNNIMVYGEPKEIQLARNALELELIKNLITEHGHVFTLGASNRNDLYIIDYSDNHKKSIDQKIWARNIPEISAKWRYPLLKRISKKSNFKIEPTIMTVLGRDYEERFNKFMLIDTPKNELSENNIFTTNKFSGIDYHEYGKRLSYGLNSAIFSEYLYVDTFLGQSIYKNNVIERGNSEYVGNIRTEFFNNSSIFYRFRRDQNLKPIQNELGIEISTADLISNITFAELHNATRYFSDKDIVIKNNKISQIHANANYRLYKNLWLGGDLRLDITNKKLKILVRTIRVTYQFDCVSINGMVTDNYLQDHLRGIKKARSKSFSVGLKVLNM